MTLRTVLPASGLLYNQLLNRSLRRSYAGLLEPPYRLEPRYSISLITPAYNEEKYIQHLLVSGQHQTEPVIEHVVAVSGDDQTAEMATLAGGIVVPSEPGNISASRNQGAAAAKGEIYVFADADVLLSPWVVERLVDALDAGAVLAHPRAITFYDSWAYSFVLWGPELLFKPAHWVAGWCQAMRREDYWNVGGFDASKRIDEEFEGVALAVKVNRLYGSNATRCVNVPISTTARRYKHFGLFGMGIHTMKTSPRAIRRVTSARTDDRSYDKPHVF